MVELKNVRSKGCLDEARFVTHEDTMNAFKTPGVRSEGPARRAEERGRTVRAE